MTTTWTPKQLAATWAKVRAVFAALGIPDEPADVDALVPDGMMMLGAQDTWRARFASAFVRVAEAVKTLPPERIRSALPAIRDMYEAAAQLDRRRLDEALAMIATPRGQSYLEFFLAAQIKLGQGALSPMAPFVPASVAATMGPEHHEAQAAELPEQRMRALALATETTMEAYYKPILKGVWTLSALMVGAAAGDPPRECGRIFRACRQELWPRLPEAPWPAEFLDDGAKAIRNASAHRSIRYDAATNELVLVDGNREERLDEAELRRRLGELFHRAHTMRLAFLWATGQLEAHVEALDSAT